MQIATPLEFILHKMKTGYGKNRIAGIFQKKFPLIPVQDFPALYEYACDHCNAEALTDCAEDKDGALQLAIRLKEITDAAAEKLKVSISKSGNADGKPYITLSVKGVKGGQSFPLYQGTELYAALEIAKRATACTEAQKKELIWRLPKGYNMIPAIDGKFILELHGYKWICEGTAEQCLSFIQTK